MSARRKKSALGFSLIEVVIAVGLTSFSLLTMLGLFSVGLQDLGASQRKVEAANALSSIVETRLAAPGKTGAHDVLPALEPAASPIDGTAYVTASGNEVEKDRADFQIVYEIWPDTRSSPGSASRLVRIHLLASWPATAAPAKAAGTSEILTSAFVKR